MQIYKQVNVDVDVDLNDVVDSLTSDEIEAFIEHLVDASSGINAPKSVQQLFEQCQAGSPDEILESLRHYLERKMGRTLIYRHEMLNAQRAA